MRTVTKIIAAATFICGFAAPHQWLGTLICIALLWADSEQKKKEKIIKNRQTYENQD